MQARPLLARRLHAAALLLTVLGAATCGQAGRRDGTSLVRRDSGGMRIVESGPGRRTAIFARLDTLLLELPGAGAAGDGFVSITGVARTSSGDIVVADGREGRLTIFDSSGTVRASFGRKGDGPGEFRFLQSIDLAGDTIVAWDGWAYRVSLLDLSGRVLSSIDLRSTLPDWIERLEDGTVFIGARVPTAIPGTTQPAVVRDTLAVMRLDAEGAIRDTVGRFGGPERVQRLVAGSNGSFSTVFAARPFGHALAHDADGGSILLGTGDSYAILRVRPGTGVVAQYRVVEPLAPPDPDEVDRWRRSLLARARSPAGRQAIEERFRPPELPDARPAFTDLLVSTTGELWAGASVGATEADRRWDVFAADGALLGHVTLPAHLVPEEVGSNYVLGVWTDSLDIESVRMYRLARAER